MRVYIANFGRENYAWPECLRRNTIATMNDVQVQPFWTAGDRDGYIDYHLRHHETRAGKSFNRAVTSRWYNLMSIIAESHGDTWVHREKDQLWWTTSRSEAPTFERIWEPVGKPNEVVVCHKPCEPWRNANRTGNRLQWAGLHPKAQEFLFTEGTLQQLRSDNADYALALIDGGDLSPWHTRPDWQAKAARRRKNPGKVFNPREIAVWRMVDEVKKTVARSNGQQVLRTLKNKDLLMSEGELSAFLHALIKDQEGLCSITRLPLQFDTDCDDIEMLCSLDRIDSDGHYSRDNLQIVCRFVNRWKSNGNDGEFRRLMDLLRE